MDAVLAHLPVAATYILYATAAFLFVPAGRDIVRPGYAIMPGDAPIMKAMKPHSARAVKFTWGVWGVNHCMISALKIYANYTGDVALLKILTVQTAAVLVYLVTQTKPFAAVKADITPFRNLFALELLAIAYLAFA